MVSIVGYRAGRPGFESHQTKWGFMSRKVDSHPGGSLLWAQWIDWNHTVARFIHFTDALVRVLLRVPDHHCRCTFLSCLVDARISPKRVLFGGL